MTNGACILSWIPIICKKIENDEMSGERVLEYLIGAQRELNKKREQFCEHARNVSFINLTNEERNAVDSVMSLQDKLYLGYYYALKYLMKYVKTNKKSNSITALKNYQIAELTWKRLLGEMLKFAFVNLLGRKLLRFY